MDQVAVLGSRCIPPTGKVVIAWNEFGSHPEPLVFVGTLEGFCTGNGGVERYEVEIGGVIGRFDYIRDFDSCSGDLLLRIFGHYKNRVVTSMVWGDWIDDLDEDEGEDAK